jgi:hypothetical protein
VKIQPQLKLLLQQMKSLQLKVKRNLMLLQLRETRKLKNQLRKKKIQMTQLSLRRRKKSKKMLLKNQTLRKH